MKTVRQDLTAEGSAPAAGSGIRESLFDYIRSPAYKRLLDRVSAAQAGEGFKSVSVLSRLPGEGRTFFVSVLALGYAVYLRKRVLIMDTVSQTRNEALHLATVLGELPSSGRRPGSIDLITTKTLGRAGSPGPVGCDAADFQIAPFMAALGPSYDLILLDTCALSAVTEEHLDPVILAKGGDAAILVTSPRSLDRDSIARVQSELSGSGVKLLGTVYNSGEGR